MRLRKPIFSLLALTAALLLSAASKPKNALSHISFGKYRIVSVLPTGLRSVRAGVEMEAKNDTSAFLLQDVKLAIFRKGEPFAEGVCDEISVPKGTSTVRVTGEFELDDAVSLWSAVTALRNPDLSEFTGNVDLTVVPGKGRKVAYTQQNLSLSSLGRLKVTPKPASEPEAQAVPAPDLPETAAQTADKPAAPKAEQPQKTTKPKKRPWWQFWKR